MSDTITISDLPYVRSLSERHIADSLRVNVIAEGDEESLRQLRDYYKSGRREWASAIYYYYVADRFDRPEHYYDAFDVLIGDTVNDSRAYSAAMRMLLKGVRAGDPRCIDRLNGPDLRR